MAVDIVIPDVGELATEVTFVRWLKEDGDLVAEGEPLFEVDTEKSLFEVEAFESGRLGDLQAEAGERIAPQRVVARIYGEDEWAARTEAPKVEEPEPAASSSPAPAVAPPLMGRPQADRGPLTSPRARILARGRGVELAAVRGTGPDGLITERDVEEASRAEQASTGDDRRDKVRRAVIERTVKAWQQVPHFTLYLDADVTDALAAAWKPTVLVAHAVVQALRAHPECNLVWQGSAPVRRTSVDLGLLVDADLGLLLSSIRNAEEMSRDDLARALAEASERARTGRLLATDFAARSVTISNLGMFSVDGFTGVIPTPDCLLLTVGRARQEPRWRDGAWQPRRVMPLGLSIDHRALDGADGARLLTTMEEVLTRMGGDNDG